MTVVGSAPAPEEQTDGVEDGLERDEVGDVAAPRVTEQDELDEAADLAARPVTRSGRRARAPRPPRLSPARAVAGAAVSVGGVLLGIGTLLWVSDDPSAGPGPVVQAPVVQEGAAAEQLATQPEPEPVPVDPPAPAAAPAPPAAAAPPAPSAPAAAPPAPAPVVVPITVLNNSRYAGLADRAAARFEAGGWPVKLTGNFRGRIRSTTVYYAPGQEAAAREFARRFPGMQRVLPRFRGLPGSGLTVVLTRDYA